MVGKSERDDKYLTFQASEIAVELFQNGTLSGRTVFLGRDSPWPIIAPLEGNWGNGNNYQL